MLAAYTFPAEASSAHLADAVEIVPQMSGFGSMHGRSCRSAPALAIRVEQRYIERRKTVA
jgi:hypothetical protein